MRLTLLTTSLDYGGAEKQVVCLARAMKQRGCSVNVISMLDPVAYTEDLAADCIPLASLRMRRGIANPIAVTRLASLLRLHRPQVLHTHMVGANLLGRIASLIVRPPVLISTAHNINEGPRWRELAYRLTDRLSDLTTNVSMAGVKRYVLVKAVPQKKIMFMPNGVEPFEPVLDAAGRERLRESLGCGSRWIWLAVGNLRKAKDYATLLRAISQLPETARGIQVLIVGSGEEQQGLDELSRALGLGERVRFLGMRRDVPRLLEIADGFVMSSAWEGLPLSLIEASLASVPIVATDVGGNNEIVKAGVTGLLVPPRNPGMLRDAMVDLQESPDAARAAMGAAGREFALSQYSMARIADHWIEVYAGLLVRHRERASGLVCP